MQVSNAVVPTQEQLMVFLASDFSGPVCMLNLLKFKDRAVYEDGRKTNLSGAEAYALYGQQMKPYVISKGGRFIFSGRIAHMMIGVVDESWDVTAIVEYPSKEAFVEVASSPDVREFAVHRSAGLEGQLLIATSESVLGG
jgi:uncharacterized protein (DUF1330 family)